jgi:hypothetical protein
MKRIIKVAVIIFIMIDIALIAAVSYVNSFRKEYSNSKSVIDVILKELQNSKIIAIGENHNIINEELFIADNIQALYNAGVRYIFTESSSDSTALPTGETYWFPMFYPWMAAGWRFEEIALYQAVSDFNNTLPADDKIQVLCFESVPDSITDFAQRWNMRDSSSAEGIIKTMDTASDETKAIIYYGAAHTTTDVYKQISIPSFSDSKFEWLPLGYLLKNHYGNDFQSYLYDAYHDKDFIISSKYQLNEPRIVLVKNIPIANIPLLKDGLALFASNAEYDIGFDGYIVDLKPMYSSFYQYNPTNENLSFIFKTVEDYALKSRPDNNYIPFEPEENIIRGLKFYFENVSKNYDYTSPDTTYFVQADPQGGFMLGLYYLKLYFGDKFDYNFWKTGTSKSLFSALTELKDYAFANNDPSEYVQTNFDRDTVILYHEYMFLSNIIFFNEQRKTAKYIQESYLLEAREIFPEDLWPLYWLGFVATEKEQWEKGLTYFQELFSYDLAFSMESLPLAYQKAALCAVKTGKSMVAEEYNSMASAIYNEYNIVVDKNRNSYVGYFNGLMLSR